MVTTQWNQGAPYNNLSPTLSNGSRCVTGCVATAMAQILKYWAYDQPTAVIPAYVTNSNHLSLDELPATTFNYAIMQDTYTASETGASADEVAKLMLYCGQAVQMDFDPSGSGANIDGEDFTKYFGYNVNAITIPRCGYKADRWDEIIYGELEAERPVLYTGSAYDGGHAFVCDGFKDGLYHINWGWGGYCDGYYTLALCDPNGSGTGGSSSEDGYTMWQDATIRLQPGDTEEQDEPAGFDEMAVYAFWGYYEGHKMTVTDVTIDGNRKVGSLLTLKAKVTNNSRSNSVSLMLRDGSDDVGGIGVNIDPGTTADVEIHFNLKSSGEHTLTLYSEYIKENTNWYTLQYEHWTDVVTIEGHKESNILGTEAKITNATGDQVLGTTLKCSVKLRNRGAEDFTDDVVAVLAKGLLGDDGYIHGSVERQVSQEVTISAGKTKTVSFEFEELEVDYYYWVEFYVYDSTGELKQVGSTYAYLLVADPSGIKGIKADGAGLKEGTPVFNLRGQRVGVVGDSLPKGLYMVKGRKFVVK